MSAKKTERKQARPAKTGSISRGDPSNKSFDLNAYPFHLIGIVDRLYAEDIDSMLLSHSIDRSKRRVLGALKAKNPSSISEISNLTSIKVSTISKLVERMRVEGLVATAPRELDNRITDVFMTEAGMEAMNTVSRLTSKQYRRALEGLSDREVSKFCETLHHILKNLRRSPLE